MAGLGLGGRRRVRPDGVGRDDPAASWRSSIVGDARGLAQAATAPASWVDALDRAPPRRRRLRHLHRVPGGAVELLVDGSVSLFAAPVSSPTDFCSSMMVRSTQLGSSRIANRRLDEQGKPAGNTRVGRSARAGQHNRRARSRASSRVLRLMRG